MKNEKFEQDAENIENAKIADEANRFLAAMEKISKEIDMPIFAVSEVGGVPFLGGAISNYCVFALINFLDKELPDELAMAIHLVNEKRKHMAGHTGGETIH